MALASGGARGLAHIGAIEALEEHGFEITSVAGTSMGALIGGIYAAGHLDEYRDWVLSLSRMDVLSLVDFSFDREGFVKGERVIEKMQEFIPDTLIEDLDIPFTAVATDILNEEEILFDKGSLYDAIRASISIPGLFQPVKRDGRILVDGGVVNPLPLDRVVRREGDILAGVDVSAYPEKGQQKQLPRLTHIRLLYESSDIMTHRMAQMTIERYRPDILISIPSIAYSTLEFYKAEHIIADGARRMNAAIENYRKKLGA